MVGSYDRGLGRVRVAPAAFVRLAAGLALGFGVVLSAASVLAGQQPEAAAATVLLQLRVFAGPEDITKESRLLLFPRGQRTGEIPTTLGADQAFEATVAPGFYDIQTIHERKGQVAGIRWVEHVLVQRYPDEYGRHLQVLNLNAEFGALQIRPAPNEAAATRGWTATAHPPGDAVREVAKARPVGSDLIMVLPAGRYDIRVSLGDRSTTWMRDVDIPADRTRLKTWSAAGATP